VLEDGLIRGFDNNAAITDALYASLFASGPAKIPPFGSSSAFATVTLDTVRSYAERAFRPANAMLIVTGAVDPSVLRTALPGREVEFREGFLCALEYARILHCPRGQAMAGLVSPGAERARMRETYAANLSWAAAQAQAAGVDVLIEPIAARNIPGYFLNLQEEAHILAAEIGKPNLKVQMDLFHCQVAEGDLAIKIRKYLGDPKQSRVGHFQIAGVPERHEPSTGEVNYDYLFDLIDELGYAGWIGCEYTPRAGTSEGLEWFRKRRTA